MNFFREYKKQLLIIIAFIVGVTAVITAGRKINATFVDNALGFVITPLQGITTSAVNWIEETTASIVEKRDLGKENAELKRQLELLTAKNERLSLFEQENKKLSELLEIAQKYPEYETTGAQIIAKDPGNWYDNFIINKGTKDGLCANLVITAAGGLVGRIVEAGGGYAKAQSILDSRSSVAAMSLRTGDLGVVRGDFELMNDGLCVMEYIDAEAEIMEGDEIVTSHLSEYYPPGICIGYVKEIRNDSNGLTKYAIIESKVDFKHLDTVLVINKLFDKGTDK